MVGTNLTKTACMSINALPAATLSNAVILHNATNVCSEILTRPLLIIMRRIPMRLWRALILNWRVLNLAALWCNLQYLARMAHCLRRIFRSKSLILFLANATIHLHSACCLARNLAVIRYRLTGGWLRAGQRANWPAVNTTLPGCFTSQRTSF